MVHLVLNTRYVPDSHGKRDMRADDLIKILNSRPFQPVRLHISSGEYVDIRHPELAMVTRSVITVGIAKKPGGVLDYTIHYNLLHVVKVEPLNGQKSKGNHNGRGKA